jgi:hypothetical protein
MSKLVNEGENRISNILFGAQAVDDVLYLGLFLDNEEPGETAGLAGLTEPTGNGYERVTLNRGSWVVTGDTSVYAEQTFTASGGNWGNVYGYFIGTSEDNSGKLLFVELFSDGPYNVFSGDSIKITPTIILA